MKNKKIKGYTYVPVNLYNIGGLLKSGLSNLGGGSLGGGANALAGTLGGLINPGGVSTGVGNTMQTLGGLASNIPGVGGLIGGGINLLGGLTNAAFGSKIDQNAVKGIQDRTALQSGLTSNAMTNEALLGDMAGMTMMGNVNKSDVGKDGWFSNKAKNKTRQLNADIINANLMAQNNMFNRGENIQDYNAMNAASQFFKYGGSIHIKPENKGKFTAKANRADMGVQEYASHVLANKEDYPSSTVKQANFARNASKWHADGGPLYTNGANFTNGLTFFDEGGEHEENPNGGIVVGMDEQGSPNLVEEGEVKWNDYIFSNKLKAKKSNLEEIGLLGRYDKKSYSDIAKDLSKESNERPNDPISKNGLLDSMTKLMMLQEMDRAEQNKQQPRGNKFAWGGDTSNRAFVPSRDLLHTPVSQSNNWWDVALNYTNPQPAKSATGTSKKSGLGLSDLRYIPALGGAYGVFSDAMGWTNKPDYTSSDLIGQSIAGIEDVNFNPIGNYMAYNPLDRNYYTNKLQAQQAASRRAIENQSGGNRSTAMAGILASDYGMGQGLGNLARQAEEYNLNQRQMVQGFNRATDMFNSEGQFKASALNRQKDELRLKAAIAQADIRDRQSMLSNQGKMANLTNLFDSLGDIGREEFSRNMIMSNPALYYTVDRQGNIKYKDSYYNLPEEEQTLVDQDINKKTGRKKAQGGFLTIKRR